MTERLRDEHRQRHAEPGSQLSEVELANSFGVSRGPVREALQRLVQEGLLRSEPHRGVFVPVLTDEDVHDVYLARDGAGVGGRSGPSSPAASTAARVRDRSTSTSIEMEKAAAAGDWEAVGNFDLEFHVALVDSSRQPAAAADVQHGDLRDPALPGVADRGRRPCTTSCRSTGTICDLMQEGDTEQALAVLKKHFDDAVVTLTKRQRTVEPPSRTAMRRSHDRDC